MQEEDGILIATFQQAALGVLHEQGVAVVDGVAQLEGKYSICGGHGELGHDDIIPCLNRVAAFFQKLSNKTCSFCKSGTTDMLIFAFTSNELYFCTIAPSLFQNKGAPALHYRNN